MNSELIEQEINKIYASLALIAAHLKIKEEMETPLVIKIDHEKNLNRRRDIAFKIKTKTS
jgi:hypothetical protein